MRTLSDVSTSHHSPAVPATPRRLALLAALALLAGGAAPAAAQNDACIPVAAGVPALSGPPNWWNSALPAPQHWPRVDDPRWRGAFVHLPMPGAAATEHVTFRALRTAGSLYLIWYVTVDPLLDADDQLWVAFSPGGGAQDMLINVVPFNVPNTNVPAAANAALPAPFAVSVATRTTGNPFAAVPSTPDWLDPATTRTRVFRSTADNSWAVLMEVPIDADFDDGLNLQPAFSMWFEVQVTHTSPNMVPYRFPGGVTFDAVAVSTNATGWKPMRRTLAPTDPLCMKGVSLAVADVGIVPDAPSCANLAISTSSAIKLTQAPANPGLPGVNVLCARPKNDTTDPIAAGDVDATFRTANWGTQADWNSVPNPLNTLWQTINATPVTGGMIGAGGKGALAFTWNLTVNDGTVNDACRFNPQPPGLGCGALPANSRKRHQCTLVELSGAPGVTLTTSSVYRNMDFVNASTFTREAEVSVVGLQARPVAEPQRDVYLYVQTNNMPAEIPDGGIPEGEDPRGSGEPGRGGRAAGDQDPQRVERLEQSEYATLRDRMPTYQVHAFHETGLTSTVKGKTWNLLAPQTSFGYFVQHQGPLAGWSHELQGAELIAPGYYLVAVPENGTGTVTTVIAAIEPRRWSLSLHAGLNAPEGDFGTACDGGLSLGLDLEYRFNRRLAAEAFFGRESFDCGGSDDDLNHFSASGKVYLGGGHWRPFVGAGVGAYDFSDGSTEAGFSVLAGLQANPSSRLGVEATVRQHFVSSGGEDANFLTAHLGLRIRF